MKSFNVVCGLPRSGSTLLCNILNQNPNLHASSTSIIPIIASNLSVLFSNSPEVKAMIIREGEEGEIRLLNSVRSLITSWYRDHDKQHVFDKGRQWAAQALMLKQLFPAANIICTVRDPRMVMASIEKQHRNTAMLDMFQDITEKGIYNRADIMFSPTGLIGSCIVGVEDLVRRNLPGVIFVSYEMLSRNPSGTLKDIYEKLYLENFTHDFTDVKNTSQDVDALYLNKFTHIGAGQVTPDTGNWNEYVSKDLAELIMGRYPFYNQVFGYSLPMTWNPVISR